MRGVPTRWHTYGILLPSKSPQGACFGVRATCEPLPGAQSAKTLVPQPHRIPIPFKSPVGTPTRCWRGTASSNAPPVSNASLLYIRVSAAGQRPYGYALYTRRRRLGGRPVSPAAVRGHNVGFFNIMAVALPCPPQASVGCLPADAGIHFCIIRPLPSPAPCRPWRLHPLMRPAAPATPRRRGSPPAGGRPAVPAGRPPTRS